MTLLGHSLIYIFVLGFQSLGLNTYWWLRASNSKLSTTADRKSTT